MKPENEARSIAIHFYDNAGIKSTQREFARQMGIAKNLLDAGYTKEELIQAVDYCIDNPPKNGFTSLGWLFHSMSEIIVKIRAQEIRAQYEAISPVQDVPQDNEEDNLGNKEKFLKRKPKRFKGQVKF